MVSFGTDRIICEIMPDLGGAILSLRVDGQDLLRPARRDISDVRDAAYFPLLPFANRIANGRFVVGGHQITLSADPEDGRHALHGHGWRANWQLTELRQDRAVMAYKHEADEWPWDYRAEQRFLAYSNGLSIELSIVNSSDRPMPVGAGIHPFFCRTKHSSIRAHATALWRTDAQAIPYERAAETRLNLERAVKLSTLEGVDNYFDWGEQTLWIEDETKRIMITAPDAGGFQLYVPSGESFFCAEPTDHEPNRFAERLSPKDLLAPSAQRQWRFRIELLSI